MNIVSKSRNPTNKQTDKH